MSMLLAARLTVMYHLDMKSWCPILYTVNTLRTGAFKLFKYTFPGSKQFKSTFIMCFLNIYNKFANNFCELKFSGNTHRRP